MTRQVDLSGRTLGHYHILERIGLGGMGEVYRARDIRLEREVAVKVLPPGSFSDESARRRFRKEALSLSKLNHPNIETAHDFDTQEGIDFLVMELIPGATLDARIAEGPMAEREIGKIGEQVAEGLAAAHGQGVVHRDIKPGNIRVTPEGRAKILDFGLAKRVAEGVGVATTTESAADAAGGIAGTLPYMSPEQLRGERLDGRTDLYSLGAVLYEMATGRRPFPEESQARLIGAILSEAPKPPRALRGSISGELERIVLKSLEKDPGERYQSARELAVDLRRVASPSASAAALRRSRRRGVRVPLAALVAGGVVAALAIAAVALDVGGIREHVFRTAVSSAVPSLAVLPLANLSGNPDEEYFADGMTDELITRLSQIRGLKVISRTSSMQYKGSAKPVGQVARELHVKMLVEGSVQRAGGEVRVNAKLIDASTDQNLWADSFQRALTNIFALQNEIARTIAERVRVELTPAERVQLTRTDPVSPEAHAEYLRGRFYLEQYGGESFGEAMKHLNRAIEIDPGYAPAYAALARTYTSASSITLAAREAMPRARALAQKALALDTTLVEAHLALTYVTAFYDWDWRRAEIELRRNADLYPNSALAQRTYAYYLTVMGRFDNSSSEYARARSLDPLDGAIAFESLFPIYNSRQYDRVIRAAEEQLRAAPDQAFPLHILGQAYIMKREYGKATETYNRLVSTVPGVPLFLAWLAYAENAAGQHKEALATLERFLKEAQSGFAPAYAIAVAYAGLGDKNQAFAWLERGFEDHSEDMIFLNVEPGWDPLRSDPRFAQILRKMGFRS
jgi:eukaryotic-like serine/threonine-protein kinase